MSALARSRSTLVSKPWFATFIALAIGLLAGLIVPQGAAERERIRPFATRLGARLKAELIDFADRSISRGLGRR